MNILGKSVATAEQMAAYLLSQNENPKIKMPVLAFCRLFLYIGALEGVRGDFLFAQSCKETGHFAYGGTVNPEQNNFAGLGTTNANTPGATFPDEATGILAQAQHAKGYATTEPLNYECVDPRYSLLGTCNKLGSSPTIEGLGGKWAVPGHDTKKYASLEDANKAQDSYGYQIINILNKIIGNAEETGKDDAKMKILLISGHGAGDPGATAKISGVTYKEADETIKIVELIYDKLRHYADVDCYPLNRNAYKDVQNGAVQVDFSLYDYILEVHFNACVNDLKGNGKTTGTEIYVTKADGTTAVEQNIVNAVAAIGFKNRGVKKANYAVINKAYKASAESALIEICFIDDADDMRLYAADRGRVADAIAEAILRSFNLKMVNSSAEHEKTHSGASDKLTGASNAVDTSAECPFVVKLKEDLNIRKSPNGEISKTNGAKKGYKYTITQISGTWGKLKSGAGWISISSKYVSRA